MQRTKKFLWLVGLLCLVVGTGVPLLPRLAGSRAQDEPPLVELNEEVIKRATVFVMQTYQNQGQPVISCVGSGTLVSANGLILTNAHSALPSDLCRADQLVIAVTVKLDEPPIPTYTAEVVESSRGLDLAMLRITGYLDGRAIEANELQLPFVELGDSNSLSLDATITIVGYPSLGSDPVAVTRGTVSGFTAEKIAGDRAWIRTNATIPGTMSGGGAYDRDGKLIGIPTIAPATSAGEVVDCRVIQDTNQDGLADRSDDCVPVGGFISALRPSRLARGMVRGATLGIRQGEDLTETVNLPSEGTPTFSNLYFSTAINEAGVPSNVVGLVPTGIPSLYLLFDYNNMVDGMIYELRVSVNDIYSVDYSLPPVTWSGGKRGTWYIGSSETPLRNGLYSFRLFIEGREVASSVINVGGGANTDPAFSNIVFGLRDEDNNLAGTGYVLPDGSLVEARFNYQYMAADTAWTYIWYFGGQELTRSTETWDFEQYQSQATRTITAAADFVPGQYRLQLYISDYLSAPADFVIAGSAASSRAVVFPPSADDAPVFTFATDEANGQPAGSIRTEFPAGIESLYIFFNWQLIAPGTMWTRRWYVDDDVLFEVTEPWDAESSGTNYYASLTSLDALPDGRYKLEISMANIVLASAEAKVGLGQLPVEAFASAEGVQMSGRITDAETGQGIPGAMFIVLKSEFSIEDFTWDGGQVLGYSIADSAGHYQIPVLLPRGTEDEPLLYSVLVRAEGYLPINTDGITVIEDTPSPVELNVELSRN